MQTLKIMLLGPSGSGKTVFLGSLYHRLHIQHEEVGFFLDTDFWRQKKLIEIFRQIAQTAEWPVATDYSKIEEWYFTSSVKEANQDIHRSFEFSYIDYSGERLTGTRLQESKDFEKALKEAHIYLGLLDGQKVLELMRGIQGKADLVDELVFTDIPSLLAIMERATKPIHFVITKWDLLEGKYTLGQVREQLRKIPEFGGFVTAHIKHSPIRFMPISSVGFNFVEPQEDGTMKKRVGAYPEPFQLEMVLACVLLDYFLAHLEEFNGKHKVVRLLVRIIVKVSTWKSIWNVIRPLVKPIVYARLKDLPVISEIFKQDAKTFKEVLDFTKQKVAFLELDTPERREEAKRWLEQVSRHLQESLDAGENRKTPIGRAVTSFMALQTQLEQKFRESLLLQEDKNK